MVYQLLEFITTVFLTFALVYYAWEQSKYTKVQTEILRHEKRPFIELDEFGATGSLIKNTGKLPAQNIHITFSIANTDKIQEIHFERIAPGDMEMWQVPEDWLIGGEFWLIYECTFEETIGKEPNQYHTAGTRLIQLLKTI